MNAQELARHAKATGRIHLGGEMEFDINHGPQAAFTAACRIAEACGYLVGWHYGKSAFSISGGYIPGYAVLDWFDKNRQSLVKIELWTSDAAYTEDQTYVKSSGNAQR